LPAVTTRLPNVVLAGDFVQSQYPARYLERATMTGLEAARRVVTRLELDVTGLAVPLPPYPDAFSMRALKPMTRALRRFLPPLAPSRG
jgi:hypothetical protein